MKKKLWHPDPKIAQQIKPYFDQGYSALAASKQLISDEHNNIVKNPNIKTYIKYWRYWKEEFAKKFQKHLEAAVLIKRKQLEHHYLTAYDRILLMTNEMLEVLLSCGDSGTQDCDSNLVKRPDIPLENMILIINKHFADVKLRKYETENDILLFNFNKKKLDKRLYRITKQTHSRLLRVVKYLAKRETKDVVLDCQIKEKPENKIVIKCGICATKLLQVLIHKMQVKKTRPKRN